MASDAVRTGSLEHVLFPHDPVHDAPAIIHDLATLFPAAKDHFIFGPMAKLGWGTPTLITADLGIVIEYPGPRIAVLGILRLLLPDPDEAIVALNMAVAGLLDFPAKKFSLDASLFDSVRERQILEVMVKAGPLVDGVDPRHGRQLLRAQCRWGGRLPATGARG